MKKPNSLKHFFFLAPFTALIFLMILAGCQLLRPYTGPITPVPDHWKGSYNAPDAGQPAIPQNWKDNSAQLTASKSNNSSSNPHIEATANSSELSESNTTNETKNIHSDTSEPCLEDVRRDLCNWWEVFQDPTLNQLEEQALDSSYTLWAALERVIEARAQARIQFAPLLPAINFNPSYTRSGSLMQSPISGLLGGQQNTNPMAVKTSSSSSPLVNPNPTATTSTTQPNIPNTFRFVQTQYLLPLNLSYEVDLWSQLNNAYYAALIRAQAASQAYLNVLLSLTADIATAYFQLRGLDAQQAVLQKTILARQHAFEINQARYDAGLIVYLDVSRAEVELARARSDNDNVKRLRGLQENLIATLIGTPASIFSLEYDPILIPPPVIPRGLPSELLCRRPDIGQAERNLAAAYRDIGVAYANFFPSLNLNASLGLESPNAHELFNWKARFWEFGLNIMQTVFDAGRNQANYDYYKAVFRESMANYQQTVLQAFQDVEDSLVNLRGYANQAHDLATAVRAASVTLELAEMRYNRGLINYLDVVDAERQLLETEQNAVITLGNRYTSTVLLIRALGGGWGPCDFCEP